MIKKIILGAFLVIGILFITTQSPAMTIGFNPVTQNVTLGNPAVVDLFISGLGNYQSPSLGVFDLDIGYNPAVLSLSGYVLGPYLGNISLGEALDLSLGETASGSVNIAELSLLSSSELDAIQPGSIILASLTFNTLFLGTSPLGLTVNALGDANGDPVLANIQNGSISVSSTSVPEPCTFLLVCSGLAGIAYFRRMIS